MSAASRPARCRRNATTIEQEGVYIDNFKLVDRGRFREKELMAALTGAQYPARNPVQNINDLKAQIAANEKGVAELRKMVAHFTLPVVQAYMGHVQDNAAESVRRVIDRLHDSEFAYEMDQGTVIKVKITVDKQKREATVDFTGTSPQQPTNFNAPEPVTRAAVLYVFRVMVDDDIPMNAGCLRPINIVIPKSSMLTPRISRRRGRRQCRDVAGGDQLPVRRARRARRRARHHEQSHLRQRALSILRDDLLRRAGRARLRRRRRGAHAHDQFAADRSGGAGIPLSRGAGGFPHPQGSGGKGKWHAGDGIRRTIRFLEKMECTILSGHRRVRPFGLAGGEAGQVGENWARRKDGRMETPARLRRDRDRRRRGGHHPDADGGGIWDAEIAATERRRPPTASKAAAALTSINCRVPRRR